MRWPWSRKKYEPLEVPTFSRLRQLQHEFGEGVTELEMSGHNMVRGLRFMVRVHWWPEIDEDHFSDDFTIVFAKADTIDEAMEILTTKLRLLKP